MPTVRPTRLVDTIGMLKERKSPKLLWLKAISIWFRKKKTIGSIWAHAVFQKPLKTSYDVRFSGQLLPEWKRQVPYQLDIQSVEWAQQSEKGPWPQDWVLWWIRFNLVPDYQFMIFSFSFSNFETQGDLIKPRNVHECTKWWWEPWRRTTGSIDMSPFWPLTSVKFFVFFWKVFVPDYFIYCGKKNGVDSNEFLSNVIVLAVLQRITRFHSHGQVHRPLPDHFRIPDVIMVKNETIPVL